LPTDIHALCLSNKPLKVFKTPLAELFLYTVLLLYPLWYNGAPLYYPDSTGYVFWGWKWMAPPERAGIYGFFIKLLSFGFSLRLTLFVQTFACSYLLRLILIRVFQIPNFSYRILVVIVLSLGTSLSWTASMLMPDLFCAIAVLSLLCFLILFDRLSKPELILLASIAFVSSIHHASIFLVNGLFLAFYSAYIFLQGKFKTYIKPIIFVGILTVSGYVAIGSLHKVVSGRFFISKSANAFLVARFAETGVLSNYQAEYCGRKPNPLCEHKRKFPMPAEYFLWNEASPIRQIGGLHDDNGIMSNIVADVFKSPKLAIQFVYAGLKSGLQQLFLFEVGDGLTPGYLHQLKYAGNIAYADAAAARQQHGIPFDRINMLHYLVLFTLVCVFAYYLPVIKPSATVWIFGVGILCILLANAFVNGAFSTPLHRYQARVFWLIAFWLLAVLYPLWQNRLAQTKLNRQNETGNSNSGAE
jgi:hypothetical protein